MFVYISILELARAFIKDVFVVLYEYYNYLKMCLLFRLAELQARYRDKEVEVSCMWCLYRPCMLFVYMWYMLYMVYVCVWHSVLTCFCLEQLVQFQKKHEECDVTKVRAAAVLN